MDKRERFGQVFTYFILIMWFATEVLLSSTLEYIFVWKVEDLNVATAMIFLVLLVIQIVFFQKYTFSEIAIIVLITVPIIIATIHSGHNRMMSTWIFIVAAKLIDFETLAKFAYRIELLLTILIIYLFYSGVINEYTIYRKSVLRHSLGFSHPNQLGVRIFLLVVCRCYLRRKKLNYIDWAIILFAAQFVNKVSNSKTSFYALVILAVLTLIHLILQRFDGGRENLANVMIYTAVCCNIISIVLSSISLGKYPILKQFDYLMSRRFSCCNKVLKYYGIKLFGQNISLQISRPVIGKYYHFWLDNAYMSILLRYGPIVFIIYSVLYIATMILLRNIKEYMLVEILCLYAIYGIMENNFFSLSQNMFLLLLSYPIYKKIENNGMHKKIFTNLKITW